MKRVVLLFVIFFMVCSVSAQKKPNHQHLRLYAKSILNQKAPELVVEKWLSKKPETKGKFVLIDFWATSCGPCKRLIPLLNDFSEQFRNDLVIIGISEETEEKVKQMKEPVIRYYEAIDTKKRMSDELEVSAIPHVILIDPDGIVRWEGYPLGSEKLTAELIKGIIAKYTMADSEQDTLADSTKPAVRPAYMGKSVLNQQAPKLVVDRWITEEPKTEGKFVIMDRWSTTCGPCKLAIPKLNEWSKLFKKDLVVIGLARDDSKNKDLGIEYYRGVDTKTFAPLDLHILSYVLLVDPKGIVRWEGVCKDLTTEKIQEIITKYK